MVLYGVCGWGRAVEAEMEKLVEKVSGRRERDWFSSSPLVDSCGPVIMGYGTCVGGGVVLSPPPLWVLLTRTLMGCWLRGGWRQISPLRRVCSVGWAPSGVCVWACERGRVFIYFCCVSLTYDSRDMALTLSLKALNGIA